MRIDIYDNAPDASIRGIVICSLYKCAILCGPRNRNDAPIYIRELLQTPIRGRR